MARSDEFTTPIDLLIFSHSKSGKRIFMAVLLTIFAIAFILHSYSICTRHWFEEGEYHVGLWAVCNYTVWEEDAEPCNYNFKLEKKAYMIAALNIHCLGWIVESIGLFYVFCRTFSYIDGDEHTAVPGLTIAAVVAATTILVGHLLLTPVAKNRVFGYSFYYGIAAGVFFVISAFTGIVGWVKWDLGLIHAVLTDEEEIPIQRHRSDDDYYYGTTASFR